MNLCGTEEERKCWKERDVRVPSPKQAAFCSRCVFFSTVAFGLHVYMTNNYLFRKWNGDKHKWNLNVYTHSKITSRYAFGLSKMTNWMNEWTAPHTGNRRGGKKDSEWVSEQKFQKCAATRTKAYRIPFLWRKTHIFTNTFTLFLSSAYHIVDPCNFEKSPKNETSSQQAATCFLLLWKWIINAVAVDNGFMPFVSNNNTNYSGTNNEGKILCEWCVRPVHTAIKYYDGILWCWVRQKISLSGKEQMCIVEGVCLCVYEWVVTESRVSITLQCLDLL